VSFRTALRTEAKPLIGLYSESGCGKTYSSLLLARGFVGARGKIGMIETEAGRGEVFVGDSLIGQYVVRPVRGDFAPTEYGKAITEAEQEKLDALIIDSASHEWEGAGGVLGMAAQNQADGKKGPIVWQKPKMDHQRHFMLRLMQTPIPLVIVCMRAKYPMKEIKKEGGAKEWIRSTVLEPKQADDILFEMMVHAWIDQEHQIHVTKWTKEEFRRVFLDGQPITVETGQRLAQWAAVGTNPPAQAAESPAGSSPAAAPATGGTITTITNEQAFELMRLCQDNGIALELARRAWKVTEIGQLGADSYEEAQGWIERNRGKGKAK